MSFNIGDKVSSVDWETSEKITGIVTCVRLESQEAYVVPDGTRLGKWFNYFELTLIEPKNKDEDSKSLKIKELTLSTNDSFNITLNGIEITFDYSNDLITFKASE